MSDLWCIRIPGPDDVWAMRSKEAAEAAAEKHNAAITKWYAQQTDMKYLPTLENMKAVVEPWPWSEKCHKESLAEQAASNGEGV